MDSTKPSLDMHSGARWGIWRITFPNGYAASPTRCKNVEIINAFSEGWKELEKIIRRHNEASNAQ